MFVFNPDLILHNIYSWPQAILIFGMGLQGIKDKLDCGRPDMGSTYRARRKYRVWNRRMLPKCMFEALVEAERSTFLKDLLGKRIYDNYMALKIAEWEEHRTHVTPREHRKYLSI